MVGVAEVLVEVAQCGICGSDLHLISELAIAHYKLERPHVLGHEASGTVVQKGKAVTHLSIGTTESAGRPSTISSRSLFKEGKKHLRKIHGFHSTYEGLTMKECGSPTAMLRTHHDVYVDPGDRVAMEPGQPCWDCDHCKSGRYHLCRTGILHGIPHQDGFLRRRLAHPAEFCFNQDVRCDRIPETVSDQDGALVEPLAVGYWACRRAQVFPGARVLVLGAGKGVAHHFRHTQTYQILLAGPIGLCVLLNLKAAGAGYVVITDVRDKSLQRAKTMGADACVQVSPKEDPAEVAKKLSPAMGDRRADITIDCVGFEHTMRTAIFATKAGGNVTIVGLGQHEVKLPILDAVFREVDIRGVNRYPHW
ncbi:hypothetical protein LAZ67_15002616 [Cordylochernes scorpioides]|uniref:Sorbitol dehydrogenase n=1 Tax=Cordylochernes scorpioides TaxID=51811 RepID=A0ABY6LD93_9ARAC|nr:hypothetical protein LAZ67_15002616 [Cordylochernes scorpioides]